MLPDKLHALPEQLYVVTHTGTNLYFFTNFDDSINSLSRR